MKTTSEVSSTEGERLVVEEVTACFGEQSFSPIQYFSFKVGPFFCKTKLLPGETAEAALNRAFEVCLKQARAAYPIARDFHLANAADAARSSKGSR